jgi:hypothetical protein
MAIVRVSAEYVAERLFGFSRNPVQVTGIGFDPNAGVALIEINGADIPAGAAEVRATITQESNRAGERLHRLTFDKVA